MASNTPIKRADAPKACRYFGRKRIHISSPAPIARIATSRTVVWRLSASAVDARVQLRPAVFIQCIVYRELLCQALLVGEAHFGETVGQRAQSDAFLCYRFLSLNVGSPNDQAKPLQS